MRREDLMSKRPNSHGYKNAATLAFVLLATSSNPSSSLAENENPRLFIRRQTQRAAGNAIEPLEDNLPRRTAIHRLRIVGDKDVDFASFDSPYDGHCVFKLLPRRHVDPHFAKPQGVLKGLDQRQGFDHGGNGL